MPVPVSDKDDEEEKDDENYELHGWWVISRLNMSLTLFCLKC